MNVHSVAATVPSVWLQACAVHCERTCRYANLHNLGKSLDESKVQNNQAMQLEEAPSDLPPIPRSTVSSCE